MPIDRKRRIFRPAPLAPARHLPRLRPTLAAGSAAVLLAAGLVLALRPTAPYGRVSATGITVSAPAAGVAVIDGETLRLADSVVRLRGVVAPARGRQCQRADGHGFDCGAAAAQGLAGLVGNRAVTCRVTGSDAAGFPQGRCSAAGTDLNRAVVAGGWARAEPDMPGLAEAEAAARAANRGLWGAAAF